MLAVCDGFSGTTEELTCDRARGDMSLSVNPLKPETLLSIRYRDNGVICSDEPAIDLDLAKTLNLNQKLLVRNRKETLRAMNQRLEQYGNRRGNASVQAFCKRYVDEHLADASTRQPYDGIVLYFMQKRMRAAG